ncbi:CoA transferase [Ignatzschineria indica]|uniref:CoA transferase n=2 Tax=Ignatzschineria indica TaxID=472583 RepID=A0A2U2AJB8_9GAMM|nr:CoA transferase [Ignatzschineria indica]
MVGALDGIRVLDITRVLAGPWCTQYLADLGAEVIKIERPQSGDDTRAWGPPYMISDSGEQTLESSYYMSANRGKLSVALDFSSEEGQKILQDLVKDVDVLVENYKVGGLKKYGLDYESLIKINPRLVYCSITGYGQTGPRAKEPGYDFVVQGLGGLMSITGENDNFPSAGPQKVGVAVADLMSGTNAALSICAALYSREMTGEGQHIDIALLDTQVAMLANQSMNYLTSLNIPGRYGNAHANIVPYNVFKASDREFVIACGNDRQFVALSKVIGLPDLPLDPRFATNAGRVINREEITEILAKQLLTKTAKEWIDLIAAVNVPVGPINNIKEAIEEPQIIAREMVVSMEHPLKKKNYYVIGSPLKFSKTPVRYKSAPPLLGQHTKEVLVRFLGMGDEEMKALTSAGVISLKEGL